MCFSTICISKTVFWDIIDSEKLFSSSATAHQHYLVQRAHLEDNTQPFLISSVFHCCSMPLILFLYWVLGCPQWFFPVVFFFFLIHKSCTLTQIIICVRSVHHHLQHTGKSVKFLSQWTWRPKMQDEIIKFQ